MAMEGLDAERETGGGGSVMWLHSSGRARLERPEGIKSDVSVITLLRLPSIGLGHISGGGGRNESASGG